MTATVSGPSFIALQVRALEAAASFYETNTSDCGGRRSRRPVRSSS